MLRKYEAVGKFLHYEAKKLPNLAHNSVTSVPRPKREIAKSDCHTAPPLLNLFIFFEESPSVTV